MILDSNIIIYSALPEYETLRDFIRLNSPAVSVISRVEVLGFPAIEAYDLAYFEAFFASATTLPVSSEIIECAIGLRKIRKISLGDALIAATAVEHSLDLVTKNTKDFKWITTLTLFDPFEDAG